jgi:HK97 family phage major capsid protein
VSEVLTKETRAELFSKAQQLLNANPFSLQVEAQFKRTMQLLDAVDIDLKYGENVERLRSMEREDTEARSLRTQEEFRHFVNRPSSEKRTYTALTAGDTPGSFIVPTGQWLNQYQERLKSSSGWLRAGATLHNTATGAPYLTFFSDDSANVASIQGENVLLPSANPVFTAPKPDLQNFATSTTVSNPLLQDGQIGDLDAFLQGCFGGRVGRKLNTFATSDATYGLLAQLTVGATAASTSLPTLSELSDMQGAIDSAYVEADSQPVYMAAPALISLLRKQVTTGGQRIYPEIADGKLLGLPLIANVDMSAAAGSVAVVCGSVKRAVLIQSVNPNVVRSGERYAEINQTFFGLVHRLGVKLIDANAVTALKLHS